MDNQGLERESIGLTYNQCQNWGKQESDIKKPSCVPGHLQPPGPYSQPDVLSITFFAIIPSLHYSQGKMPEYPQGQPYT